MAKVFIFQRKVDPDDSQFAQEIWIGRCDSKYPIFFTYHDDDHRAWRIPLPITDWDYFVQHDQSLIISS